MYRHLLPYRILGLCPVCWICIIVAVLLVYLLVRLLHIRKKQLQEDRQEN